MTTSSLIQKAYELTANSNTRDKLRYADAVRQLLPLKRTLKTAEQLVPLNFYLGILDDTNSALFPFLDEEKKNQILRDLQVTYLLLLTERNYEKDHQKTENSKKYTDRLKQCQSLIDQLLYIKTCEQKHTKPAPDHGYQSEDRPYAYMGFFAGRMFANGMVDLADGSASKDLLEDIGYINVNRLNWVWDSSFLKTMLDLLPDDFLFGDQAKKIVRLPDPFTGTMSWGLYYFRFALNLSLLLKHTIAGPWMSEAEKSEPWTHRFKTQWDQRKFALLNDLLWATGNLACFFWLIGKGAAGTWGDMLTLGLLVFDIAVSVWKFEESRTQYNQQVNDYQVAIDCLEAQKIALSDQQEKNDRVLQKLRLIAADQDEDSKKETQKQIAALVAEKEKKQKELIELSIQLSALIRAKNKCASDWSHKKTGLAIDITYAVGLMLAFVLLTAPFMPLAAATLAAMTISGAVLCFAFSVIYNAVSSGLDIHKTKMTTKELKEEYKQKVSDFKDLVAMGADENVKKIVFLELKKLSVESEHQQRVANFQIVKLLRSVLIESMIPPLVFLSFVFLPLGPGLGILAAAVALAAATHFLLQHFVTKEEKGYEKKIEASKQFDENEYQEFCDDPDGWGQPLKKEKKPGIFNKHKDKPAGVYGEAKEEAGMSSPLCGGANG